MFNLFWSWRKFILYENIWVVFESIFVLNIKLQGLIKALLDENFAKDTEFAMKEPILFGDYRNALEESEPRLYEDLQDYDATKALFTEVSVLACDGSLGLYYVDYSIFLQINLVQIDKTYYYYVS